MFCIYSDFPSNKLNLNNPGSINSINIFDYLDLVLYYLIGILISVLYLLVMIINLCILNKFSIILFKENFILEIVWIIVPSLILVLIGVPSIFLLYNLEWYCNSILTVKVIGVQWYWIYNIYDIFGNNISITSYTLSDNDISLFRLIEVDNCLYLPILTPIKILVTSLDVILSFAIPSLGIKIDAIPGRINAGNLFILRKSLFIGYCSELCGVNLSKMNINIYATNIPTFIQWFLSNV